MAREWNRLKDKLGGSEGPNPSDWEAMRAKIDAQPTLAPVNNRLWLGWLVAGTIGVVIGLGSWLFWPGGELPATKNIENRMEQSMEPESSYFNLEEEVTSENTKQEHVESPVQTPQNLDHTAVQEPQAPIESTAAAVADVSQELAPTMDFDEVSQLVETDESSSPDITNPLAESSAEPLNLESETDQSESTPQIEEPANEELGNQPAEAGDNSQATAASTEADQQSPLIDSTFLEADEDRLDQRVDDSAEEADSEYNSSDETGKLDVPAADSESNAPFLDPRTGFKLNRFSAFGGMSHELREGSPLVYGGGIEFAWQKDRQFFTAGLGYYRIEQPYDQTTSITRNQIDSTWSTEITNREVINVSRVWVIDSFQAGRYVYDTTVTTVRDTSTVLRVDTNQIGTSIVKQLERPYYFAELPLLYGYDFGNANWRLRLAGGVALQQAISYSDDENGSKTTFGLSALLQPELEWRFNRQWSVISRWQLRYPLQEGFVLYEQTKLRYSFQMGVSYRW